MSDAGASIIQSDQYSTDPEGGQFFMRVEFQIDAADLEALPGHFATVAGRFGIDYTLTHSGGRGGEAVAARAAARRRRR